MPEKGIGLIDISTGERSVILPGSSAVFSPDGRWLAVAPGALGQGGRISIIPFRGLEKVPREEWITVGDEGSEGLLAAWSPGGELLFFIATSHSDPSNCVLKAQRFHPDIGKLEGPLFDVYRFEEPLLPLLRFPLNNRLAISPGQIIPGIGGFKGGYLDSSNGQVEVTNAKKMRNYAPSLVVACSCAWRGTWLNINSSHGHQRSAGLGAGTRAAVLGQAGSSCDGNAQ